MPELPEVETIARLLKTGTLSKPSLIGQTIVSVHLFWNRTLVNPDLDFFRGFLPGKRIIDVSRRAKFLLLRLDEGNLVFHLRMSGDLYLCENLNSAKVETPAEAHDRLYLNFISTWRLVFNDTRKFGRVWLLPDPDILFSKLGPEPFDPNLDTKVFYQMLHKQSRQLKPLLMDQKFLAGLGNIYTDEALFSSRLHPLRISDSLSKIESEKLLWAIRDVLTKGIEHNGASIDWVYRGGDFQNYFQVYQQTSNPCPNCGAPIQRLLVGQRSTHICPNCQLLKE